MNPPCARCKKTVYPVEKFSCLDKTWHKGCFTCEVCNLKLTMKTYKGYNKLPYCNTHYPTTRFTAVADTPEAKRLAQQQKNQSEVNYRKDKLESMKGFTQVADSVANRQAAQASQLASSIGYHTAPSEQRSVGGYDHYQAQIPPSSNAAPTQQYIPEPTPDPAVVPQSQIPPASFPDSYGPKYVALYDYTAGDDDEISFQEGDVIVDVTPIDEGWMEGRNSSTGQYGMFPSNYVQPA